MKKKSNKILILQFLGRAHSVSVDIEGRVVKPPHSISAVKKHQIFNKMWTFPDQHLADRE